MRALLDTNIILDLFLDRQPFVQEAVALWEANEQGRFDAYISAITPVNLFYIARKFKDVATIRLALQELVTKLRICSIDQASLQAALSLPFADYEDAVQHASAVANGVNVIITRNLRDYANATIPVYTPDNFLKLLP